MAKDAERDEWLVHLRRWGEAPARRRHPAYGANWQRVNVGALEAAAGARPGDLARWWNGTLRGAGQNPTRVSREDYLKLCPWLAAWYGYEPPTSEWQFL